MLFAGAGPFCCPACGGAVLFESCTAHQNNPTHLSRVFCFGGRYRTRTARAERSEGNQSPSGALISARFPTRRNVYRDDRRFVVGGTGLEQQRRRPPPAAETGSRGWDSVLIFQSPAKGLRKNQQTQPVQAPAIRFRQGSQRLGMSTKKDAAKPFGLGTFFRGGWYRTRTGTSKGRVSS